MNFKDFRDAVNEYWDRYGDELSEIEVFVQDEDGIMRAPVNEVTTAGGLYVIIGESE